MMARPRGLSKEPNQETPRVSDEFRRPLYDVQRQLDTIKDTVEQGLDDMEARHNVSQRRLNDLIFDVEQIVRDYDKMIEVDRFDNATSFLLFACAAFPVFLVSLLHGIYEYANNPRPLSLIFLAFQGIMTVVGLRILGSHFIELDDPVVHRQKAKVLKIKDWSHMHWKNIPILPIVWKMIGKKDTKKQ